MRGYGLRKFRWLMCCLAFFALASHTAMAQDAAPASLQSATEAPEYGGIVTREVLTSQGYNFFLKFSEAWREQDDYEKFNILVKERPYPRGAGQTEILIAWSDLVIVRQFLPRDSQRMTELAVRSAGVVREKILDIEVQSLLFNDPDIAASGY